MSSPHGAVQHWLPLREVLCIVQFQNPVWDQLFTNLILLFWYRNTTVSKLTPNTLPLAYLLGIYSLVGEVGSIL